METVKTMLLRRFIAFAVLLLPSPFVIAADAYKWTDADGNVHYSDTPPRQPAVEEQQLDLSKPSEELSSTATGLRPGEREMLRRLEQQQTPAAQPEATEAPQGEQQGPTPQELCAQYTQRLEDIDTRFEARQKAREELAAGNYSDYRALRRTRLRRQLQQEYQEKIAEYCKPRSP